MRPRKPRTAIRAVLAACIGTVALVAAAPVRADEAPATPAIPVVPSRPGNSPELEAQEGGRPLTGTFRLKAGACAGAVSGSRFRMIQPGGNASGPFVQNSDSPCADKTVTPLRPGRDGGLATGVYQAQPTPPFDSTGGGRADRITTPQTFFGVNFATATNATDPQTGSRVAAPEIRADDTGRLTGDLRSFAASWNNQHFNQGSPKPDGSRPGATAGPTGTYDTGTGTFVLEWTSQIVGGPFNNFTGQWHLEGTFSPASAEAAAAAQGSSGSGGSSGSNTTTRRAAGVGSSTAGGLANTGASLPVGVPLAVVLAALLTARRVRSWS